MAEAAAHNASYLCWPTWPQEQRERMSAAVRPQAEFLRANEKLLNETSARQDIVLFLPFRRWLDTDRCVALDLAAELSRANIQFGVVCEDQFNYANLKRAGSVLLVESVSVLNANETAFLKRLERAGRHIISADQERSIAAAIKRLANPSLDLSAPATVRGVVRDQPRRTVVHLLNLNIQKRSSFEDQVQPVENVGVRCRVSFRDVRSVRALSADSGGSNTFLNFSVKSEDGQTIVETKLPRLEIATILVIERGERTAAAVP
jgi:hypothetical protein